MLINHELIYVFKVSAESTEGVPVKRAEISLLFVAKRFGTMIAGFSPVIQGLLGTLFTWGLTAVGAALVFVFSSGQKRILDGSLGFAAGVMLAASYWSLLAPAIDMAEDSGKYGAFSFLPVAVGFSLGAAFVYLADLALPALGVGADPHKALALPVDYKSQKEKEEDTPPLHAEVQELSIRIGRAGPRPDKVENGELYQRKRSPLRPGAGAGRGSPPGRGGADREQLETHRPAHPRHHHPQHPRGPGGGCGVRGHWKDSVRHFRESQEPGHRHRNPELPRRPCSESASQGERSVRMESLLVWPAQWHGGAGCRVTGCGCRGDGGALAPLRAGLRCGSHGVCGGG
ncbi:hypothetical protein COCON_G00020340 [Conger conger]|uniref:Zinc transporter ZIP11 n=1 Tax=Conger conger TaxID=82655 RepID=A0A9Q1I5B8_CONCO|nr:hypothetical protein COCON_G00020340 [Conger conger]